MLNAFKSRFSTSRKRSFGRPVGRGGERSVVRYTEVALAGGCPPSGTHDQLIVMRSYGVWTCHLQY